MHEALHTTLGRYPRIVFDLDGTLYDLRDYERPALAEVAAMLRMKSGQELPGIETAFWAGREADRHSQDLFDTILDAYGLPSAWIVDCIDCFRGHDAVGLRQAPSLAPLIARLRANGNGLALVSNGRPEVQMRKLQNLGLPDVFDSCVFCHPDRPEELKPRPWAWNILKTWRGETDTIYVGDDAVDDAFARCGHTDFVHFSFRNPEYGPSETPIPEARGPNFPLPPR